MRRVLTGIILSLCLSAQTPLGLPIFTIGAERLFRIETVNELPNGEYGFTIPGSNQFFCFTGFRSLIQAPASARASSMNVYW